MTNKFHVDAVEAALSPKELVMRLFVKAEEYLNALMLDTGLKVDTAEFRTLQKALLEDFIEVQNSALKHRIHLPEGKSEVDKLLS